MDICMYIDLHICPPLYVYMCVYMCVCIPGTRSNDTPVSMSIPTL